MQKAYRLKKNGAFQYVYRKGKSVGSKNLVMLYAKGKGVKVGFSVSKKVGNAVMRNRIKRRLRECFRPLLGDVKNGSYVIVARTSAATAAFTDIKRDVHNLLKRENAFREMPKNPGDKPAATGTNEGNSAT